MDKLIIDNDDLKYRVIDSDGKILRESLSRVAAERFVEGLDEAVQADVKIVPVGPTGKQVLFG